MAESRNTNTDNNGTANNGTVVTVGTYDGVHLGHQRLIGQAIAEAQRRELRSVLVTFDRNPIEIVRPEVAIQVLTELDYKLELLRATGIDDIVVLGFDQARAKESAEDFVRTELVGSLGARAVLVGSNFRFGHRQQGDVGLLTKLGTELGFAAYGIDLLIDDKSQTVVSSSRIRELIAIGAMSEAARLLGRPHQVFGDVLLDNHDTSVVLSARAALPPPGPYQARIVTADASSMSMTVNVALSLADGSQLIELDQDLREGRVGIAFID